MASMCRTVALLLSVGVCALAEVSSSAELTDKAYNSFYFLGPWHVVERSEAGERKLALNFTAGSDEWTLQSAVLLQGQDDQVRCPAIVGTSPRVRHVQFAAPCADRAGTAKAD